MHTTHYAYPFQGEFIIGKNTRFLNVFSLRLPVVNRPRLRREIAAYQVNRSVVCSILTGISFFLDLLQGFRRRTITLKLEDIHKLGCLNNTVNSSFTLLLFC